MAKVSKFISGSGVVRSSGLSREGGCHAQKGVTGPQPRALVVPGAQATASAWGSDRNMLSQNSGSLTRPLFSCSGLLPTVVSTAAVWASQLSPGSLVCTVPDDSGLCGASEGSLAFAWVAVSLTPTASGFS